MSKSRKKISKKIGWDAMILFLEMRSQIKAYHWQSIAYSMHKSLDKLLKVLVKKTDLFVEAYIGLHGRFKNKKTQSTIVILYETSETQMQNKVIEYIRSSREKILNMRSHLKAPEYINILDEILAALDRTLYLLTLK